MQSAGRQHVIPVLNAGRTMEPEGQGSDRTDDFSVFIAAFIGMGNADDFRPGGEISANFGDQTGLFRVQPASNRGVAGRGGEELGMGEAINRAFADHEGPVIIGNIRHPEALFAELGKALEIPVALFETAKPCSVVMGKQSVCAGINAYMAPEPWRDQNGPI